MCCSVRAAVFFLASLHVYFAISQLVNILPTALSNLPQRSLEAFLALIFALFFFSSGFMCFRGADEESSILIGAGGVLLFLILIERFLLMHFSLLLNPTLPEADFLNAYGTTIPIIFTIFLYIFYLSILFVYYNELKDTQGQQGSELALKNPGSPRHFPGIPAPPGSDNNGHKNRLGNHLVEA